MTEQSSTEEPGYGRSRNGLIVHRIHQDGRTYCPDGEVTTISDWASARDAVSNHGARFCTMCAHYTLR